jgi:hypothetical protein
MHSFRILTGSLAVLLQAATAFTQDITFTRDDFGSYAGARAVVAGDFDRNGWPDLALANAGRNTVTILLNDGGGEMRRAFDVAAGAGPFALTSGDFNRDGIPDLAVANADANSISVLTGRGDGTFTRTDISTSPYLSPRGITTTDVNVDGKADLVYTGYGTNVAQILTGRGDGGFSKGAAFFVSDVEQPEGLGTADFNHDGHLDLAIAHGGPGGLSLVYSIDDTTIQFSRTVPGANDLNLLATGDVNGDGWTDIAAGSTATSRVAIYLGGASGLAFTRTYAVDAGPRGLVVADVTGDGRPDVITASRARSTVTVLRGDPAHAGMFLPRLTFGAGAGSRAAAAADFDADGRLDIATGNQYAATATVLLNATSLQRPAYAFDVMTLPASADLDRYRLGLRSGRGFAAADFNRDGALDFVQHVRASNSVAVVLVGGATVILPAPGTYAGHVVGDVNRDGNADVVSFASGGTCAGTRLATHVGNGAGAFTRSSITCAAGVYLTACIAGDLNRDAKSDLACVAGEDDYGTGPLLLLRGNGNGTFGPPAPTGGSGMDPQLADINRDGRLDVVLGRTGQIWLGDGNGGVTRGDDVHSDSNPGWRIVVAELNHDGYPDLVHSYNGESMFVTLGGPQGYREQIGVPIFCECDFSFAVADINVDGHPDIIVNSVEETELAGNLLVMAGRGDGTFGAMEGGWGGEAFAFAPGELLIADVTGDGLPDLLAPDANGIHVLVNRRTETNRAPVITPSAADITIDYFRLKEQYGEVRFQVDASDRDQHGLWVEWSVRGPGSEPVNVFPTELVGTLSTATTFLETPGTYEIFLTVNDQRGGVATAKVAVITVVLSKDIVLHMAPPWNALTWGRWSIVNDPSAASGVRAHDENLGAPKVTAPAAQPAGWVEHGFLADPTQTYKLWLRLKADNNHWSNDSVWVQFSGATDLSGKPAYRIGTTSGLAVNLEECAGCGVSGWGWEDDGWGAVDRAGVLLRFPEGGWQRIMIQTREDGVSVDQIVLSADKYVTGRPGAAKNDRTILPRTQ